MPNPKRRHTRARRDSRRAQNWKLEIAGFCKCSNCGALRRPHNICPSCGFYKDRVVKPVKSKEDKKKEAAKAPAKA